MYELRSSDRNDLPFVSLLDLALRLPGHLFYDYSSLGLDIPGRSNQ